jgi:hypothetical protein
MPLLVVVLAWSLVWALLVSVTVEGLAWRYRRRARRRPPPDRRDLPEPSARLRAGLLEPAEW